MEGQIDGGAPLSSCLRQSEVSGLGPQASSGSDSHLLFISDQTEQTATDRASPDRPRRLLPQGWRMPSWNDLGLETVPRGGRPFK